MEATHVDGGFRAPVFDAQHTFRAIMDAIAQPGTVQPIEAETVPPAPLSPTTAAVALALCDHDTPVWLDPPLRASGVVANWLGFHTLAPLAHTPAEAHFAIVSEPAKLIALDNFAQGTQEYPDRSATIILQVESLEDGTPLMLKGPGIERDAHLAPTSMPRLFVDQWRQNNARFPRGVDIVLAAPGAVACLPRTTRVSLAEV